MSFTGGSEVPDSFFKCRLCSETLEEPKLLACLHRYCRECLVALGSTEIACHECGVVTKVPIAGVRDLETDFHTKQVIECREAHQNILGKGKKKRECAICGHVKRCSFYCFKCTGLLCEDCHHLHTANEQFKPHRTALINVKNVDATALKAAFSELTRMMDAPRCRIHPTMFLDILCYTCQKVDICMACKFGEHKDHRVQNMREVAQRVRDELRDEMTAVQKPDGFWDTFEGRVREVDSKMKATVAKMLEEAKDKVKKDINVIQAKREMMKEFKQRSSSRFSVTSDTSTVVDSYDIIGSIHEDSGTSMSYDVAGHIDGVESARTSRGNGHKPTKAGSLDVPNDAARRTSSTDPSKSGDPMIAYITDSDSDTMEKRSVPGSPRVNKVIEDDSSTDGALTRSNSTPTRSKNGRKISQTEEFIAGSPISNVLSETRKDLRRSVSDTASISTDTSTLNLTGSSFYGSLSDLYSVNEDDDFTRFTRERMSIERYNDALVRFLENLRDRKLSRVFEGVASLRKRYENLGTTVKIIGNTQHDWAALKCAPAITKAAKVLASDLHNHQKNVGIVEKIGTRFIASATLNHFGLIEVSGSEISVINLEDFMGKEWIVRNACWVGGSRGLAISSHNTNGISQVTHFSLKGRQNRNREFNGEISKPWRFVAAMSKKEVATAAQPTEIGVHNLEHDLCSCKDLREITPKWSRRRWVQSIAVDRAERRILVGSGETDGRVITGTDKIEVYDYQLFHQRTLTIPQIKCCPQGLAVHGGRIFVCDYYGKKALCCDAKDGALDYEFPNLELDEGGWQPFSVCVDGRGHVYILWDAKMAENWKQIVIRYTAGGQPLTMRTVDMNAMCIAITPAHDGNERLTVVDREKGEMTHYGIL